MRKLKRYAMLLAIVALAGIGTGCGLLEFLRSAGFNIHTTLSIRQNGVSRYVDYPRVIVIGNDVRDFPGAAGNTTIFDETTDDRGRKFIAHGRAPALWKFVIVGDTFGLNACHSTSGGFVYETYGVSAALGTVDVACHNTIGIFDFTASPQEMDVQAPPATVTLYGQGLDATYGMPSVEYWDQYGNMVMQTGAAQVSPDGTWATANVPYIDPSVVYGGYYTVGISNRLADGSYNTVGYANVSVINSNPPPLPEPDPTPEPTPCNNQDPYRDQQLCMEYNNY